MAPTNVLLVLLQFLPSALGCFCDRYAWTSWTACSQTCNHGTQNRQRRIVHDSYFWKNSCQQLCAEFDRRACHQQPCPINCVLTEFGPWSECSPCARKQFRTRSVATPSQFRGAQCDPQLSEERPCHPTKECKLPEVDCREKFKCDNGRCLNATLTCNSQNDCGDNSDERDCSSFSVVCPTERQPAPGVDLVGNGFDALAEEPRGAVLDNTFMGESCDIRRPQSTTLYHRVPYNFDSFDIKVGVVEDFSTEPQTLHSESVSMQSSSSTESSWKQDGSVFLRLLFLSRGQSPVRSNKQAFQASKEMDSKFFRVHQVLPVSKFKVKGPDSVVLSLAFQQFLHDLPLDYNYARYRDIFQRFGTHYYGSGSLGGHYDLLYQYSRDELLTSGQTEEHVRGCLSQETSFTVVLYSEHSSATRCREDKMTEKYSGSYIQASEKSFSMVKGGRTREAAALGWERQGPAPDRTSYKNWAKSVLQNPAVVDYKLRPLIELVRGIPCAVTKRRHLRRALLQYMQEFDTCKCAPCPNNARPVLSGAECACVCQTGTFGDNCEKRAPDFASEAVDGHWSCWGPWSSCGLAMRRRRTRRCDNPVPLQGGRPCQGPEKDEEPCHVSLFEKQDSCDNDDDFLVGWRDELPPGVTGCLRPQRPDNSFLRKAKPYYSVGEDEEFRCFTGFDLEGFQFINCLPDGTWTQPRGRCYRNFCSPPEIPDTMTLFPTKEVYRVGESVGLNCKEAGLFPLPAGFYKCTSRMSWEPELPDGLRCTNEEPVVPGDSGCGPGQRSQGSGCVCVDRESCLSEPDNLCILNVDLGVMVSMSACSFHAGRCHGDPLLFISASGACDPSDSNKLEWAKLRARMSSKSLVQTPCGLDTCYDWETCSASKECVCRTLQDCRGYQGRSFCIRLSLSRRAMSVNLCQLGGLGCSSKEFEIIGEDVCPSR